MPSDDEEAGPVHENRVELTRVQPFEANVIAARLRESGIDTSLGPNSVYESVSFSEGIPIFVPAEDAERARALLEQVDPSD